MAGHRHRTVTESGPYGCAGSVRYVLRCACGAERHTCSCHQCRMQGTDKGTWTMPVCDACDRRHALDMACHAAHRDRVLAAMD